MAATSTGRRLTSLIEQHGTEIAGLVATDSELRAQAVRLLRRSVELIGSASSAEPGRLDRGIVGDAEDLLDRLHARASSDLRHDIDQTRPELHAAEGKTVIEILR